MRNIYNIYIAIEAKKGDKSSSYIKNDIAWTQERAVDKA